MGRGGGGGGGGGSVVVTLLDLPSYDDCLSSV